MAADRIRNTKVILDTNALLMPFQFNINLDLELIRLLGQYEILLPSSVIDELDNISTSDAPPPFIKAASKLSEKFRIEKVEEKGDESIFQLAKKHNAIVVTNDRDLKKRLRSAGLRTISLKSKTHLVID